jgi:hypothetical protein
VTRAWREYGLAPWRVETFKFSIDPELVAQVVDVVGLSLAPPENAVVLCVDGKSQIQSLDRTAPMLPMGRGLPARRSHDYVRHGTSTLFAALEIATGTVTAACKPRHTIRSSSPSSNRSPAPSRTCDGQLRRPQEGREPRLAHSQRTLASRTTSPRPPGHATGPWPHFDQKLSLTTAMTTTSRASSVSALDPSCPVKSDASLTGVHIGRADRAPPQAEGQFLGARRSPIGERS